ITERRNNQVKEYMQLAAKKIIDYVLSNNIARIIVGYSVDFKRNSNIGRNNNRKFNQIPFGVLRQKLEYLSEINGIAYIEHEESYTSKASFLDNDPIPVYDKDRKKKTKSAREDPTPKTEVKHVFSGKRVTRGKYRSSEGYEINADINGAANIGRKQGEAYTPEAIENLKRWPRRIKVMVG
ncbi:MAG TPA: IS200/IS605 family accessory protein TnpB-related protein, partial [Thermotogota bacterium]|nr:IS200/IS605 family accessory protein TnpB-related protein [Thermotogota bacterium]